MLPPPVAAPHGDAGTVTRRQPTAAADEVWTTSLTKVTDACHESTGRTTFLCDLSPPRSGNPDLLPPADVGADFVSVAYNPGHSVRADSAMMAAAVKARLGVEAIFTLATRDMNKLAIQSHLLGAELLGLENVIVVRGDPLKWRGRVRVKHVGDFVPTNLIRAISEMNGGADFQGLPLQSATNFCIGAAADLGRGMEQEARLTRRKVQAGANFLITQPVFDPDDALRFQDAYEIASGTPLPIPVFFGLQIMEPGGICFSPVPERVLHALAVGRSGVSVALDLQRRFHEAGLHNVYLVPPIRRGGFRDYEAAREFLAAAVRVGEQP